MEQNLFWHLGKLQAISVCFTKRNTLDLSSTQTTIKLQASCSFLCSQLFSDRLGSLDCSF